MAEIVLPWIGFMIILTVYVFGFIALLFKVGDIIDNWKKKKRGNK